MVRLGTIRACLLLALGAAPAAPSLATSCDMQAINERPVDEAAQVIMQYSDIVGLAWVRQVPTEPGTLQQELVFERVFKGGDITTVKLAPDVVKGVGKIDPYVRFFHWKPGEVRLVALISSEEGAMSESCTGATIAAKKPDELVAELSKLSDAR